MLIYQKEFYPKIGFSLLPYGAEWGLVPAGLGGILVMSGYFKLSPIPGWLVILSLLIAFYDLSEKRVPNVICVVTSIAGLSFNFIESGITGMGLGFLSGLTGFGLMLFPYLFGRLGAGDVKAFASIAFFFNPVDCLRLFLLFLIIGGFYSLVTIILFKRGHTIFAISGNFKLFREMISDIEIPYCVPLAISVVIFVLRGVHL